MGNFGEGELILGEQISIVELVNKIITEAHKLRASDVHIDPAETDVKIRYRIDGVLQFARSCPKNIQAEIISRIKILAGMRTDEHQTAQDGRFRLELDSSRWLDIRASVVPTYHGENSVMRLLSDNAVELDLKKLGFSQNNLEKITAAIKKPNGMILTTGPTGSGKTTTLYSLIRLLNNKQSSIVTIEDPIEYAIDGIRQIQANQRTGLNFANGLRSILRQDPDIIMVGEIRDQETASIAVNTALTGHMLLSTLHTSDAATTLPRMLDMKVEPYLIASTVNLIIAQRLLRKICSGCKVENKISPAEAESLKNILPTDKKIISYYGRGCEHCNQTGYLGRIGIHEILLPDQNIREAILRRASAGEIRQLAKQSGMKTMMDDAIEKIQTGQTTLAEAIRTLYE